MGIRSEMTSDGIYVKGRVTRDQRRVLAPYKIGAMEWNVPMDKEAILRPMGAAVPACVMAYARKTMPQATRPPVKPSGVSSALWDALFAYQKELVHDAIHVFGGRLMLADDMGLGKTVQAIALMSHYGNALVICPAFLRANWEHELQKWLGEGHGTCVRSYDSVRANPPSADEFSCIVVDEAHYIKQRESQRTQAIVPLLLFCDHVLLLSGTPCPNRPAELYTAMHALRPSAVGSFSCFATRYCNAKRTRWSAFDTSGTSRSRELAWLLKKCFMVRRMKSEVLDQLPPILKRQSYVTCAAQYLPQMERMREDMARAVEAGNAEMAKSIMSGLYRMTCLAKMGQACQYAFEVARKTQGCCIFFSHHMSMLNHVESHAPPDMTVVRIDGKTPVEQRQRIVQDIQKNDGSIDVACLSMGAAGVGLTITAANTVVFLELPWNPAMLGQCTDRVYRVGQARACSVHYVMGVGSADEHIWKKIQTKERVIHDIIKDTRT